MNSSTYRAGIVGLGFIGAADQVSGDALGQKVEDLDGTHLDALAHHPRVELVSGSSRDQGRRERFARRTDARVYHDWKEMLEREALSIEDGLHVVHRRRVRVGPQRQTGRSPVRFLKPGKGGK